MDKAIATIGKDHYLTNIQAGNNSLIADEPVSLGGTDKGPNPGELLASSLAGCTAITLRMYTDRKEWDVEEIKVEVSFEFDGKENISKIIKEISFKGNLDEEQKQRLMSISSRCPVHRALLNPIDITSDLK